MECFFEAQASVTEDFKKSIGERLWLFEIDDGKTALEVSHENYFMEKIIDAGIKLNELIIKKNILSEDEKKLLVKLSTNVRWVYFYHPLKIDGWIPKHKIERVLLFLSKFFVSKTEFEGFLPWIQVAEVLILYLHEDTNFIDDICEWLCGSKFKKLEISYLGEYFDKIEKLKNKNVKPVDVFKYDYIM